MGIPALSRAEYITDVKRFAGLRLRPKRVLPDDAVASAEDTFPAPKSSAGRIQASFPWIPKSGTDAAAKAVALFTRL